MLLQNGRVLQFQDTRIIFSDLDIRISDHVIKDIAPHLLPERGEECYDLYRDFVLPGMVNSHSHSYTNLFRGTSLGEPLEVWSSDTVSLGKLLAEEDMALAAHLGICEMLHNGVTACVDHLPHLATAAAAAKAYQASGFRAALAPMLHNRRDCDILWGMEPSPISEGFSVFPSVSEYMDFYEDFIRCFHKPGTLMQVMAGINSPQRCDNLLLSAASDLVKKYGLNVHCHMLETKWQRLSADKANVSPVKQLDVYSLLHEGTSMAHCVWLNEEELNLVESRRAHPVSNPASNLFLGSGVFPMDEFVKRKIPVALGSDGVNCATNHNMLDILRYSLLMQRSNSIDYTHWMNEKNGYQMVTENGGSVLGLGGKLGQIRVGMLADLAIVCKSGFLDNYDDALAVQLLFHNHISVKDVIVNGEFVMKSGKVMGIDEEGLKREFAEKKSYLKQQIGKALESAEKEKERFSSVYKSLYL